MLVRSCVYTSLYMPLMWFRAGLGSAKPSSPELGSKPSVASAAQLAECRGSFIHGAHEDDIGLLWSMCFGYLQSLASDTCLLGGSQMHAAAIKCSARMSSAVHFYKQTPQVNAPCQVRIFRSHRRWPPPTDALRLKAPPRHPNQGPQGNTHGMPHLTCYDFHYCSTLNPNSCRGGMTSVFPEEQQ